MMGYPGLVPQQQQPGQQQNMLRTGTPGNMNQQLHINPAMGIPPPGMNFNGITGGANASNENPTVAAQQQFLAAQNNNNIPPNSTANNNNNNNVLSGTNVNTSGMLPASNGGAAARMAVDNSGINTNTNKLPGMMMNTTAAAISQNVNNPLFHPHLEDPTLLNNPIWKLQLQLHAISMHSLGQPNVYARQNAMKKYIVSQQQQQQQHLMENGNNNIQPPLSTPQPQISEASMSLVDRTKQLLLEMATDTQKEGTANAKPGATPSTNNANPSTANSSSISTPSTPKPELAKTKDGSATTPSILLQHKKLSHYNIDEDDEDEAKLNKSLNDAKPDDQLWHALDFSNLQVFNINKNLFKYKFLTRLYLNGNNLTSVPKEIKHLTNLRVLDLSFNRLTSLPEELGFCYQLKYLYFFDNMITTLPWQFGNLFNLQFLGCEGNPLDKQLLKILTEKSVTGLIFYLRDNRPEIPLIKDRRFIELNTDGEPQTQYDSITLANEQLPRELEKRSFTVLSYNTLCQHYATPKMYRYTPSWALSWEYRRDKMKEQILAYQSDIMCLQEVESKTYEEFWEPLFQQHGYKGLFHAKTRAKTMQTKDSKKVDGCCVFYKESSFKVLFKEAVDFSGIWMKHKNFQRTEDYLNRAMNKDNVALYLKLQHVKSGEITWVVTTHLHWDPQFNDVKTFQVGVLLDHLEILLKEHTSSIHTKQDLKKCPVIICGDLNSQLDSAVYELLSTGHVETHADIANRDYGYISQKHYAHNLSLRSSYNSIGELPFTNFTPSFTDVIDYMWYSTQALRVRGLLGALDNDYVSQFIGFPNDKFPSDHLPLLARYEFTKGGGGSRKL